jgi:hypothetical protein
LLYTRRVRVYVGQATTACVRTCTRRRGIGSAVVVVHVEFSVAPSSKLCWFDHAHTHTRTHARMPPGATCEEASPVIAVAVDVVVAEPAWRRRCQQLLDQFAVTATRVQVQHRVEKSIEARKTRPAPRRALADVAGVAGRQASRRRPRDTFDAVGSATEMISDHCWSDCMLEIIINSTISWQFVVFFHCFTSTVSFLYETKIMVNTQLESFSLHPLKYELFCYTYILYNLNV